MIESATFISCQMRHKIAIRDCRLYHFYHLDYHTCAVCPIKVSKYLMSATKMSSLRNKLNACKVAILVNKIQFK